MAWNECLKIQAKINELAFDTFKEHKGFEDFSMPLIPRISPQYLENRFVLLGQETNMWYGHISKIKETDSNSLSKLFLEDYYDSFCRDNAEKQRGAFWEFSRALYKKGVLSGSIVGSDNKLLSHCWMNLFCIEKCRFKNDVTGRPSQHPWLADAVMQLQKDLVFKIFELIKPRIILATTGHSNDAYLKKMALNVKDDEVDVLSVDQENVFGQTELAEFRIKDFNHPLYGVTIVRSYHPTFFTRQINRTRVLKEAKRKMETKNIPGSKAAYYQKLIFRRLENV